MVHSALACSQGCALLFDPGRRLAAFPRSVGERSPTWSPDGSKLAFIKWSGGGVFVAAVNGGSVTPISGTIKAIRVS